MNPIFGDIVAITLISTAAWCLGLSLLRSVMLFTACFLADILRWAWAIGRATSALRYRHLDAVPPALVIYVPGLGGGELATPGTFDWLFGGPRDAAPRTVVVKPPPVWGINLGDDKYVEAVFKALSHATIEEKGRIVLVGTSRGAGVILRTVMKMHDPRRVQAVIMLNGPFTTVHSVTTHVFGEWVARALVPLLHWVMAPHDITATLPAERPTNLPPLLFVSSEGDTAIPPDNVKHYADKYGGEFLLLGNDAPHSLMFAPLAVREKVQDFVVAALRKCASQAL